MDDREIINHLMDIKERLSAVETKVDSVLVQDVGREARLDDVEKEVDRTKQTLKTVRWISGALLITLPASLAAVAKILKP